MLFEILKKSGKIFRQHNMGYMRIWVRTSWLRDVTLRKMKADPTPLWSYQSVCMETSTGYEDLIITLDSQMKIKPQKRSNILNINTLYRIETTRLY